MTDGTPSNPIPRHRAPQAAARGIGGVRALVEAYDWGASPVGPAVDWPQSLRTALAICLDHRVPMALWWGPDGVQFYNDAWLPLVGAKHPGSLGQRAADCWAEIWDAVGPLHRMVLETGRATLSHDLLLPFGCETDRQDRAFVVSFTAVRDETGGVGGVLLTGEGTTGRILAEGGRRTRRLDGATTPSRALGSVEPPSGGRPIRTIGATVHVVERMASEPGPQRSEARYRTLFEAMDQGFYAGRALFDTAGRCVDLVYEAENPAAVRMTGGSVLGLRQSDLCPDEPYWLDVFGRAALEGTSSRVEHFDAAAGRWYDCYVFRPCETEVGAFAVLFQDVSERRRAEAALRTSEERQAFLLHLSDELRPLTDAAEITGTATRLLGQRIAADRVYYADLDVAGDTVTVHRHWIADARVRPIEGVRTLAALRPEFLKRLAAGVTVVVEDSLADPLTEPGRERFMALAARGVIAVPLVKGGALVSTLVVHTMEPRAWREDEVVLVEAVAERIWSTVERARAEAALRESEERFRDFAEASSDVLWMRNAATLQWEYLSPAFETVFGADRTAAMAGDTLANWLAMIDPQDRDRARETIDRAAASGERAMTEYRIHRPADGEVRWIRDTYFPLLGPEGAIRLLGGIARDVTEVKEYADRLEVLVAELQHRTRNLVAVTRSIADRTVRETGSMEAFRETFRHRLSALARVQGLLSRLEDGERLSFDALLTAELSAVGALDGSSERVLLDGPKGVALRSNTVQTFSLALHELATNAMKYGALAADEGRLSVRWWVEEPPGNDAPRLHVDWRESGVRMAPCDGTGGNVGYGRELIERALPHQLRARTDYRFGPDGVRCRIALPLARDGRR